MFRENYKAAVKIDTFRVERRVSCSGNEAMRSAGAGAGAEAGAGAGANVTELTAEVQAMCCQRCLKATLDTDLLTFPPGTNQDEDKLYPVTHFRHSCLRQSGVTAAVSVCFRGYSRALD
jgi:hypothetical protein